MAQFRFEKLEIWNMAISLGDELFDIADDLEKRKYLSKEYKKEMFEKLVHLSKKITNFRKTLNSA